MKNVKQPHHRPGEMGQVLYDVQKRGLTCNQMLDVGANAGSWSKLAARVFPEAKVHMIEPQAEMQPALERLAKHSEKFTYSLAAAGAESGELVLTIWDDLNGSSMLPKADPAKEATGSQRKVPVITVDELIAQGKIDVPNLIKLDVQGFELEVLRGATHTFGYTELYILEVSLFPFDDSANLPQFYEVIDFMHQRGYVVYDFVGFLRRPLDGALGQCDVCFTKADGVLRANHAWR